MTAVHTHDDVTVRHDHDHDHDDLDPHDHPGGHGHEAGVPPAGGPVVVDIGGDVGALVVHVDASRVGQELHVRRPGEAATTHTGIWERRLGSRAVVVAVFPAARFVALAARAGRDGPAEMSRPAASTVATSRPAIRCLLMAVLCLFRHVCSRHGARGDGAGGGGAAVGVGV